MNFFSFFLYMIDCLKMKMIMEKWIKNQDDARSMHNKKIAKTNYVGGFLEINGKMAHKKFTRYNQTCFKTLQT